MIASEKRISLFDNKTNVLDASFSSYLNGNGNDESFMLKLTHPPTFSPKKKVEDGEIGIFGAEKYFKGAIDEELPRTPNTHKAANHYHSNNTQKKDEEHEAERKPKTKSSTPSVRSESSWNSRKGLLVNGNNRSDSRSRRERNGGVKSLLATLGCNCNDKDSVKVKEAVKKPNKGEDLGRKTKSLSNRWADEDVHEKKFDSKEDCFTFPVLNSSKSAPKVKIELPEEGKQEREGEISHIKTRNSLEVFGSPILEKGKKSFSLERKLTMLNWDGVTPKAENIDILKNENNDTGSDASSDLFEIESFSTNGNNVFLARQASENNNGRPSNVTLPYAPSEASIDWSVVTADYDDTRAYNTKTSRNFKADEEMERVKMSGILSGCKSYKAVRVAGDEHRIIGGGDKVALMVGPTVKYQVETKLTSSIFERPLPRAHSPYASRQLYIQQ